MLLPFDIFCDMCQHQNATATRNKSEKTLLMTNYVPFGATVSHSYRTNRRWIAVIVIAALLATFLTVIDIRTIVFVVGPPLLILPFVMFTRAIGGSKVFTLVFLAAAIFLLEAVFRVRDYDEKAVDFQILIKVGSWLPLLVFAATNVGKTLKAILSTASLPWTLLFSYFLITSLWGPNQEHAAVAAFSIVVFYLFFASLNGRIATDDVLLAILMGIVVLTLASLVVYFVIPSFGRMHVWSGNVRVLSSRLSGLAGHPNTIGRLSCFGILIVADQWKRLAKIWWPMPYFNLALLVLILLLSNSRTSMAITVILLAIHFFARAKFLPYLLMFFALALSGIILLSPYAETVMQILSRSGSAEEIETGTSRTLIWAVVEMLISQKPWFGWGYGSSVFIMPQYERLMGHAAPHAHNIILQVWLTTGLVGVLLFLFAMASRFTIAAYHGERFAFILLLFVLLNGLTESSAFGGVANITTVALCVAAAMISSRPRLVSQLGGSTTVNSDDSAGNFRSVVRQQE